MQHRISIGGTSGLRGETDRVVSQCPGNGHPDYSAQTVVSIPACARVTDANRTCAQIMPDHPIPVAFSNTEAF